MHGRDPHGQVPEVPLGPLRRYTEWSLAGVALVSVVLPALDLARRDVAPAVAVAIGVALAAVGTVEWRVLRAGMAGLDHHPPAIARDSAAAVLGLALWGGAGAASDVPLVWALPFGMLASGVAAGVGHRDRRRLIALACLAAGAAGAAAGAIDGVREAVAFAVIGGATVGACAWIVLASVWIWDVTLRLDEAGAAAAELAVLRERLRFAGELHDVQGHHLQAIATKAELGRRLVGRDDDVARRHVADVEELARTALGETRALVHGYRRVDLATELGNAAGVLRAAGVAVSISGSPQAIPEALQPLFGSFVREATTNVLRHSAAERCAIVVAREDGDALVRFDDDGPPSSRTPADGDASGIAGLRERFVAAGGTIEAAPQPERGFALCGRAPADGARA